MASVLLLLPDEMLEAVDESRRRNEPRQVWLRDAITEYLRVRNRRTFNPVRVPTPSGGWRIVPQSPAAGSPREPRTITRLGTLPDGSFCAHPFRDDRGECRVCGQRR
jgi:hypothetical protein